MTGTGPWLQFGDLRALREAAEGSTDDEGAPTEAIALPGPDALPDRCDVAVIGGGLAGLACAAFLAEGGASVALIEAHPALGLGASGRHLGLVETGLAEHPHRTVAALGDTRSGELFSMAADNQDLLAARGLLDRCGGLWAALDKREPGEIDASVAALHRLGIAAEVLDPDEADRRTGAYNLGPALWRPTDGRIDPGAALAAFAEAARSAGAVLVGGDAARIVEEAGQGVHIGVGSRAIHADAVVIAAGAGSGAVDPALAPNLIPVREQALMTAPVFAYYPIPGRAGHGYTSWRQLPDGHVVVSGCRWATPHLEAGETDDTEIVDRIQAKLEDFARFHLPASEETPVAARWAWVHVVGRDGLPFVGPLPGSPQRIACCGFGLNAASFEVAAARGVADGLLSGAHRVPDWLSPVRIVRWRSDG